VAAAVAALTIFTTGRRSLVRSFAAGAFTGAALAIKYPAALVGGGPAWDLRRRLPHLAALFAGAGTVALIAFAVGGPDALKPLHNASKMVALSSPWHLVDRAMPHQRGLIQAGAILVMLGLVWVLLRGLPEGPQAVRFAAALVLAWLFATQYALPWYDGLGWAMLALLVASDVDWVLLAHTTAMSLAYLPARGAAVIGLPKNLLFLERTVRPDVIPVVLAVVLLALVLVCLRRPPGPTPPRGPAEPAP
jgi:hypothetical protein